MRLKEEEILKIKENAKIFFDDDAKLYLFGSRVDDNKKGGDIDLYIEIMIKDKIVERKIKLLGKLQQLLGEQKIDIVVNDFENEKYIYKVAKEEGAQL